MKLKYQELVLLEETLLLMILKQGEITFLTEISCAAAIKQASCELISQKYCSDAKVPLKHYRKWSDEESIMEFQQNNRKWKLTRDQEEPQLRKVWVGNASRTWSNHVTTSALTCVHVVADPAAAAPCGIAPFHIIKFYSKLSLWN